MCIKPQQSFKEAGVKTRSSLSVCQWSRERSLSVLCQSLNMKVLYKSNPISELIGVGKPGQQDGEIGLCGFPGTPLPKRSSWISRRFLWPVGPAFTPTSLPRLVRHVGQGLFWYNHRRPHGLHTSHTSTLATLGSPCLVTTGSKGCCGNWSHGCGSAAWACWVSDVHTLLYTWILCSPRRAAGADLPCDSGSSDTRAWVSLASRCFSGQLRILGGGSVFAVETSSTVCWRAGNCAKELSKGCMQWLGWGWCLPFISYSHLAGGWDVWLTVPAARWSPERTSPRGRLRAICSWRVDLLHGCWDGARHSTGLQGSLFTALPASTGRGWVGLGVLQLRVLCFVSNRKYNTIVFM